MITTNTGAKKLESSDNWREIFPDNQGAQGAHNASVGAHDAAICQTCQTINGTTNNSGHTINSGEYFIANGGKYKATASIPNGEPWASSAEPVTDNDLIGALNNNLTNKLNPSMTTVYGESNRGTITYGGVWQIGLLCTVCVIFVANMDSEASPGVLYGMPDAKYDSALSAIDITEGISTAIRSSVPCGVSTNGRCFMKEIANGHIYAISGTYVTA